MAKENSANKRRILEAVSDIPAITLVIRVSTARRSERAARDVALRALVPELLERGVGRATLESCDQDKADLQVIGDALASRGSTGRLNAFHMAPKDEPLLWLADIYAWSFGKPGAEWKKLLATLNIVEIRA